MNFKSFYIWFGLPVLLIAAWVGLVYMPADSAMKKKEGQLTAIKNERQKLEGNLQNLTAEARTQENLQHSYDEFHETGPCHRKDTGIHEGCYEDGKKQGGSHRKPDGYYNSLDVSQKTGLVYPIFEVGLKGGFLEMGRFLEELSSKTAFKGYPEGLYQLRRKRISPLEWQICH